MVLYDLLLYTRCAGMGYIHPAQPGIAANKLIVLIYYRYQK